MSAVKKFLKKEISLPSPPAIAIRIIDAVKDDGFSFNQLGAIIESDPALAARVLRLANSGFYAIPRTVSTLHMAVAILGVNVLKNIALSFTLTQVFKSHRDERFDFDRLWRRSVTAAVAAQLIAEEIGFRSDETFMTGLLQDIGVGTMFILAKDQYLGVLDEKTATGQPVIDVERKLFGFDHQEVGGELLKMWGLPESIYIPVRHHHEPESAPPQYRKLCHVLQASDRISAVYHGSESVKSLRSSQQLLAKLFGRNNEQVTNLIDAVAEKSLEVLSQFSIDPAHLKPFSQILQEANEELSRLNLSYELLVLEYKQAKNKAERLALQLKVANERLREAAFRDSLTGLYNHRYFEEALATELSRAVRYERPLALITLDIDRFKTINDDHGHQVGDFILKSIAKQILQSSRASDTVVRYGGEEFAIILPETDLTGAAVKAEACRYAIESLKMKTGSITLRATISMGVAAFDPGNPISKDKLLEGADRALYRSKHEGRNRVTLWSVKTFRER